MSERNKESSSGRRGRGQDLLGLAFAVVGGFFAVSVVLSLRGQESSNPLTLPLDVLMNAVGPWAALVLSMGCAGLGVALFLMPTPVAPVRHLLGWLGSACGVALMVGAVSPGSAETLGAGGVLGGLLVGALGASTGLFVGLGLGLVTLVGSVWMAWIAGSAAQAGPSHGALVPTRTAEREGVSAAEAMALQPTPPLATAQPVDRVRPMEAAGAEPIAAEEAVDPALPERRVDVRLSGGVPPGTQPLEGVTPRSGSDAAEETESYQPPWNDPAPAVGGPFADGGELGEPVPYRPEAEPSAPPEPAARVEQIEIADVLAPESASVPAAVEEVDAPVPGDAPPAPSWESFEPDPPVIREASRPTALEEPAAPEETAPEAEATSTEAIEEPRSEAEPAVEPVEAAVLVEEPDLEEEPELEEASAEVFDEEVPVAEEAELEDDEEDEDDEEWDEDDEESAEYEDEGDAEEEEPEAAELDEEEDEEEYDEEEPDDSEEAAELEEEEEEDEEDYGDEEEAAELEDEEYEEEDEGELEEDDEVAAELPAEDEPEEDESSASEDDWEDEEEDGAAAVWEDEEEPQEGASELEEDELDDEGSETAAELEPESVSELEEEPELEVEGEQEETPEPSEEVELEEAAEMDAEEPVAAEGVEEPESSDEEPLVAQEPEPESEERSAPAAPDRPSAPSSMPTTPTFEQVGLFDDVPDTVEETSHEPEELAPDPVAEADEEAEVDAAADAPSTEGTDGDAGETDHVLVPAARATEPEGVEARTAQPDASDVPADANEAGEVETPLLFEAGRLILEEKRVAVSMLQRRFEIDFDESCRLLDQLQDVGLIGPYVGGRHRDILLSSEEWEARISEAAAS